MLNKACLHNPALRWAQSFFNPDTSSWGKILKYLINKAQKPLRVFKHSFHGDTSYIKVIRAIYPLSWNIKADS
jgi:hypothetical protein